MQLIGYKLKYRIINGQSCEKQDEVAVPKSSRHVVPDTLVFVRLILVLVLDADNVLFKVERAKGEPSDANKNEKYVCHDVNIALYDW